MYKLNLYRTYEAQTQEEAIDLLANQRIEITRPANAFGFYSVYNDGAFVGMAETFEEAVDIANKILNEE